MKKIISLLLIVLPFLVEAQNTTNTIGIGDKRTKVKILNTVEVDSVLSPPIRDTNFVARMGTTVTRPTDSTTYVANGKTGVNVMKWEPITKRGGLLLLWSLIGGNISDNVALQAAFDAKQNKLPVGTNLQYWDATGALRTTPLESHYVAGTFVNFTGTYPNQSINITLNNLNQLTNGPGYITANQPITITGDIAAGPSPTSLTATLINAGIGAGTCDFCSLEIDAKGRVIGYTTGSGTAPVSSFNTRTGAIVSATGDYTAAQVTNAVDQTGSYSNPTWVTALAYSKLTGKPTTKSGYGITDMPAISDTGVYLMSWPRADAHYEPIITKLPISKGGTNSNTALSNNRMIISSGGSLVEQNPISAYSSLLTDANGLPIGISMQQHPPVDYATTANLTTTYSNGSSGLGATLTATGNGAISIDGSSPTANQTILVKDQTTAAQNGVYVVSTVGDGTHPFILTRDVYTGNNSSNLGAGILIYVRSGTVNNKLFYFGTTTGAITFGTTSINFQPIIPGGTCTGCLVNSNNLSDISSAPSARSNLGLGALSILNSINNSNWSGTALAIANGGMGRTTGVTGIVYGDGTTYATLGLGSGLSLISGTLNYNPTITSTYQTYGNGSNVLVGTQYHIWDEINHTSTVKSPDVFGLGPGVDQPSTSFLASNSKTATGLFGSQAVGGAFETSGTMYQGGVSKKGSFKMYFSPTYDGSHGGGYFTTLGYVDGVNTTPNGFVSYLDGLTVFSGNTSTTGTQTAGVFNAFGTTPSIFGPVAFGYVAPNVSADFTMGTYFVNWTGGSGHIATLPNAASVPSGTTYLLYNSGSGSITLNTTASQNIIGLGISYVLPSGNNWIRITSDGVSKWFPQLPGAGGGGGGSITTASGDASGTVSGTNLSLTLATVNSTPGTFGDATHISRNTVNDKGLTTAISSVLIQIAESQVTGLSTDLSGKANLAGGNTFTGIQIVPDVAPHDSTNKAAPTKYVDSAVARATRVLSNISLIHDGAAGNIRLAYPSADGLSLHVKTLTNIGNVQFSSPSDSTINGSVTFVAPRIGTITSSATPTPTSSMDQFNVTALATAATFAAPTGTFVDGQVLIIRIKDNGTARALSWNSIYRASTDFALPTTTVVNKTMYLEVEYNGADSKLDAVGLTNGF